MGTQHSKGKLTVHDITLSNLANLDNYGEKFYKKKWLHVPPSGTRAIIHAKEGLNIKSFTQLYKESHAVAHASARLKADRTVNTALDAKIDREAQWIRKSSITTYSEDHYIQASTAVDDVRNRVQRVKTCVKNAVSDEFSNMWHKHIKVVSSSRTLLRATHNRANAYYMEKLRLQLATGSTTILRSMPA